MNGRDVSEWPAKNAFEAGRAFERNAIATAPTISDAEVGRLVSENGIPDAVEYSLCDIARQCARKTTEKHDYLPHDDQSERSFVPHSWVKEAMRAAVRLDRKRNRPFPVGFLSADQQSALLTVLELADREERHRTNQAWLNLREGIDNARARLAAKGDGQLTCANTAAEAEGDAITLMQERPWHWRDTGPLETGEQS